MAADPGRPSPTVSLTLLFALALTVLLLPTAALPSNPAYLAAFPDGHCAFLIEPPMLHVLNLADGINAQEGLPKAKDESHQLPFSLDNGTALAYADFTSDDDDEDINKSTSFTLAVYAGRCNSSSATVWMYTAHNSTGNRSPGGNWNHHPVHHRAVTGFRGPGFLSAMATFAPARGASPQLLTFGGLCPAADTAPNKAALAGLLDEIYEDQSGLDSAAAYSSTLVAFSPNSRRGFHARLPSTHSAGPVAEAGLTVTPLLPMYASNRGTGLAAKTRAHQTILLLGGHTAHAFVNMSTIALLSLPEAAWSYVVADTDPSLGHGQYGAPMAVEPRSGHTATLTPDGSRVIVVGGWVGDTETPAWPQLLVLEIGIEGGAGDRWRWRAAKGGKSSRQKGIGENETGIYGHGATMLPGGILMVAGGHHIGSSNHKRSADSSSSSFSPIYLFDTTSESWTTIYNPLTSSPTSEPASVPHHTSHHSSPLSTTAAKAGLASGVSVAGAATVALVALTVYKCACLRRRRDERRTREGMLRSLALDSDADVNVAEPAMTETMGQRSWTGRSIGGIGNPFADPVGEHDGQQYQQNGGNNSPFADPKRVSDNRNRSSNHETTALLAKPLPPPPASDDGVPLVDVDLGTPFASAVKGDYHAVPGADQDGGEEHESNANEDGDRSSVNDKGNDTASTHRSRALLALSTGSNDHHHAYCSLAIAPMQSTTHNQEAQAQIERWSRMGQSIPSNNLSALMALQLATGDEILNENGNGDGHDDEDERRGLLSPVSPILASSEEPGEAKASLSPKQQLNWIPLIPCPQPTPPPSPPNPPPIPNQAPICSNTATTMEPNPSLAVNPRPINRRLSVSSSVFTPRTTTPRALLGSVRRTLGSIRRWEPDIRATRVRPLSAMLFQDEEDDDGDNDRGYGFGGYSRFAESRLRWQGRNCGAGCNAEGSGESRRSGRPGQLRPPASAIAARHNWHPDASGLLLEPQAGTGAKTALGQGQQQHQGPGQGRSSSLGATGPGSMFTDTAIENETAALMAALRPGAQDWERPRRRSRTVAATMRSTIEGSGTDSGSGSRSGAGNRTMARRAPLHARHRSEPAWKPSPHTGRPGPRVDSSEAAATSNKNNKSNPSSATTSVPPRHFSASSTSTSITPCMSTSTSTSDWDVEAAAEMRAVQVATTNAFTTFTVPRERLRVVNAGPGDRSEDEGEGPEGR